ncbi:hypothetical protein [Arthrobacter bambusae]|uniref:Uncharacterized protein n=1 Tax=Arthrobacter bambusae TaxID=1338426 RepID=A0AAW8DB19_9MICC|nr:hypothetical protein [Arthrobacter bambusae]MDP9903126.1 hypothetical protein [Arthrobacter bambusae]MDQ0128880.1 hypothetical protein [Arthrobacter bambusae]MDQ0180221.1 hypothetical protein [Arthrobacter bambusae]
MKALIVMISSSIHTPPVLHVTVPATAVSPAFSAKAMLDLQARQYYATSITMEHPGIRLTSARVHQNPIQRTMAPVLRGMLAETNKALLIAHPLLRKWATGKPQRPVRQTLISEPDAPTLQGAALVYQFAKLAGEAPVKALARAAGIERAQAAEWLKIARAFSIL